MGYFYKTSERPTTESSTIDVTQLDWSNVQLEITRDEGDAKSNPVYAMDLLNEDGDAERVLILQKAIN